MEIKHFCILKNCVGSDALECAVPVAGALFKLREDCLLPNRTKYSALCEMKEDKI